MYTSEDLYSIPVYKEKYPNKYSTLGNCKSSIIQRNSYLVTLFPIILSYKLPLFLLVSLPFVSLYTSHILENLDFLCFSKMPTSSYLPLRWESTGDQWWYATPIDWAAANGLSDLVKQLLRIDPNLLVKLTSLRRIRRLESVWDDVVPINSVARCRACTAQALFLSCKRKGGGGAWENPLIRAGYGGWLLYTAASAGDLGFVKELLEKEQVSVFGEGGVWDH